jgi:hypothetical protein
MNALFGFHMPIYGTDEAIGLAGELIKTVNNVHATV